MMSHANCKLLLPLLLLLLQFSSIVRMLPVAAAPPYHVHSYMYEKCTDTQTGRELYIGEAFTRPGQCVRLQCLGNLQIWEDRCQVPKLHGNCSSVPSPNEYLDYPKCCPMYECKTYASNENGETEEIRTYDQYGTLRKTNIHQIFVITDVLKGTIPGQGVKTQFEI